jgi:aerotaxis receptor
MSHARTTINTALDSVHLVDTLIRQIETATHEQAKGISQVNEAVMHLDTVTQQNAALVDQSNAAADALRQRSSTLERSVSVFRMH